jgi:hypothetical protein
MITNSPKQPVTIMSKQRHSLKAFLLLNCLILMNTSLNAVTLKPDAEGINITVEGSDHFTMKYPQLLNASQKPAGKLMEARLSGNQTHLKYDNGAEGDVSVSGEFLSIRFSSLPANVQHFKTEFHLGFSSLLGARWKTDKAGFSPIPEQKPEKAHLLSDHVKSFDLAYISGRQLHMEVPPSAYLQLTDCREWGWKNFVLHCTVPINRDAKDYLYAFSSGSSAAPGTVEKPKIIIDSFGQYTLKEWPLKIKSADDLKADLSADKAYYESLVPPALTRYGSLPGSKEKLGLKQTGFFHLENIKGHWYLVDPDGNWLFHLGVCSFAPYTSSTYYQGREKNYEWIPPFDGEFKSAFGQSGDGTRDGQFNFLLANRIRKYGTSYEPKAFTAEMIFRVRKFGFNSTGAFGPGDNEARREANFPHVAGLPLSQWNGVPMLIREVWDPFDEKTRAAVEKNMAKLADSANDPLLIGRFLTNEPLFEDLPKTIPGYKEDKACKRRLVRMLQEKYKTVEAFNTAWGVNLPSFEEAEKQGLPVKTQAASSDMEQFKNLFLEEFFSFVTGLIRKYDPNHLILGCRLQSGTINSESLCRIGSKYVDIWSFNYYTYGIDEAFLKKIVEWTGGKPMILSEFYWNSFADSGVSGGVKDVNSQLERGLAYRNYVEHAASLPFVVGVEWFTLLDASQTGVGFGKYNGENPNSGLFSVADRPWKPMITEMVKTNYDIYKVAAGERKPFVFDDPRFQTTGGKKNSVVASKVAAPLKIDGQGGDWPGMPSERIGSERLVQGASAEGFEGAFKLAWDETFLYILADVNDKTPMKNGHAGESLWNGDGIELFIGAEKMDQGGGMIFTDRQILISAAGSLPDALYYLNSPKQYGGKAAIIPKSGGTGYILEAAIPWEALSAKPELDRSFLFDIGMDDSQDGRRRDKQLMWNGTGRNSSDRTHWGRFRLIGQ